MALAALVAALVLAPPIGFEAIVWAGVQLAGGPPPRPRPRQGPILRAAWADAGEAGTWVVQPIGIFTLTPRTPGKLAAMIVSKDWVHCGSPPFRPERVMTCAAVQVWLTRHWTAEELTQAIVDAYLAR